MVKEVQVFKTIGGKWSWRLVANNGEILAHSEVYTRKWSTLKTAKVVAKSLKVPLVFT